MGGKLVSFMTKDGSRVKFIANKRKKSNIVHKRVVKQGIKLKYPIPENNIAKPAVSKPYGEYKSYNNIGMNRTFAFEHPVVET
jgi:hypothetical protein